MRALSELLVGPRDLEDPEARKRSAVLLGLV